MDALNALILLERLESLDRPDIAKTRTSRDSDKLIDSMTSSLSPFITTFMHQGYFSSSDSQRLTNLFRQHAQDQYLLGQAYAHRASGDTQPLNQMDLNAIGKLASDAQQDFITSMASQYHAIQSNDIVKQAAITAGLFAASLGIRSLNKGTISRAELVEFVTRRDSKVCPICESFDAKIYEVNPHTNIIQGGPTIPDDLHPNCRCRYLLVEDDSGVRN